MRINVAKKSIIDAILAREKRHPQATETVDLRDMLKNILSWADRFVPSESGSILLDDPTIKMMKNRSGKLYFVACFGRASNALVGASIPAAVGIAGETYVTGRPYISKEAHKDSLFYPEIDKKTNFTTKSVICSPIKIKGVTIGVIELINRLKGTDYDRSDLTLLKIFAGYTSTLIQNSLDAKRFGELSIRDNLTGLYNDRYFFSRLTREVTRSMKLSKELSLIFLDLDRFKEVNDEHGHLAGSRVLTEVGELIASCLRGSGAAPSRYGGDEFTIILPDTGSDKAVEYAEMIRRTIEGYTFIHRRYRGFDRPLNISNQITASFGVATIKQGKSGKGTLKYMRDNLIKRADSSMYVSKENGKNRITVASFGKPGSHLDSTPSRG